ncbi:site-specific integrase [Nonomuraea sp. NBC_00507]|uniref:tyrosine-type recombinase/integrase n=1 Tax=Nonomuraea sp. NBC_00507 TaxID=2976002 RepID=UPI002E190644
MTPIVVLDEAGSPDVALPPAAASPLVSARRTGADWVATRQERAEVFARLTRAPFTLDKPNSQYCRNRGLASLLDWLEDQPGDTWQERWRTSGAEAAAGSWRQLPDAWLRERGQPQWRSGELSAAVFVAIGGDLIRPSLPWLLTCRPRPGALTSVLAQCRDSSGFARLRALADGDPQVSPLATQRTIHRAALILAAKGGVLTEITTGDVLDLLDIENEVYAKPVGDTAAFYRMLRTLGAFDDQAPASLRALRTARPRTPDELIDRYGLVCRPIRDLLVDYLRERQPTLDYTSLVSLSMFLGKRFWADLEEHHPGIDSLHLAAEVADAWKQRLRTRTKTVTAPDGSKTEASVPRISFRECLTPVRAFYLDLAQWAIEDPGRWGRWVAPCPVGSEEVDRRKAKRHRKSRMDARTRERLPVLPILVRTVDQRRMDTAALLAAARQTAPGDSFTAAGQTLFRATTSSRACSGKIWADDPATGKRRDLTLEEDRAFWSFAIVEVLRATGVRVEELLELTHHSLVQYKLPTTGEVVPLLQIAPSKTDTERLLLVSPELADVLSAIICRLRAATGSIPLVASYDVRECAWRTPAPFLFQRLLRGELQAMNPSTVRHLLNTALSDTGLIDSATGEPLHYTPHDFRRLFLTDAILSGLPPHIAQVIAGHQDINVTLGYKAVYPDEAIQAHLAFLARRRALRPSEEYRVPTDEEWQEFLGHFELRKVATGTCGRAFGTPCIHEHSCLRCPLHWPSTDHRPRIAEIRDNLIARIAEAEREGWLGEVEGLKVSLAGAEDKLAQIDRRSGTTVDLGFPSVHREG